MTLAILRAVIEEVGTIEPTVRRPLHHALEETDFLVEFLAEPFLQAQAPCGSSTVS